MTTFKLIVTVNDNCVAVLKYLNKTIRDINNLGVRVQIEKIATDDFDAEMVNILRKRGIVRLPVLIAPDGVKFTGVKDITGLFEKNLKSGRNNTKVAPVDTSNVHDFMLREMQRTDNNTKDDDLDERVDFNQRMQDYQKRVPVHRGGGTQPERNIDQNEQQPPRRQQGRRAPPTIDTRDTNRDNIGEYPGYDLPQLDATPGAGEVNPDLGDAANDEMYRKMVEALTLET